MDPTPNIHRYSCIQRKAIDSALVPTYPNMEIVVVNDSSRYGRATEATIQIISGY